MIVTKRVKSSTGSGNARWRREPGGGNTDPPKADNLRVSVERNTEREKLNDERGVKPLPVSRSRDEAESAKSRPGWVRGRFCILPPEIGVPRKGDRKL